MIKQENNVVAFGKKLPVDEIELGGHVAPNGGWYEHALAEMAPYVAKEHAPKRICFDVRLSRQPSTVQENGFHPTIIVEGEPGFYPTTFDIGGDMETCQANVEAANQALGLHEGDVMKITMSSMRAAMQE